METIVTGCVGLVAMMAILGFILIMIMPEALENLIDALSDRIRHGKQ